MLWFLMVSSKTPTLLYEKARIQFVPGIDERVEPTVSMTRSAKNQQDFFTGTATFWFQRASSLNLVNGDTLITGMCLLDDEGSITTTDVQAKFVRGRPTGIESVLVLSNPSEWNRFMRFMTRYAEEHGLQFTAATVDT